MRYFSLGALAALVLSACGCGSVSPTGSGAVCPHCGKRHFAAPAEYAVGSAANGLSLVPSAEAAPNYAGDYGPAQVFEVTGPAGAAIRLGRILPSCSCLQVVSGGNASFGADQPARIVVRQVAANASGQVDLNVQVLEPVRVTLSIPVSVQR